MDERKASDSGPDESEQLGAGDDLDESHQLGEPGEAGSIELAHDGLPEAVDTTKLPAARLPSAAPSTPARALAFGSIVIAGLCGGLIGFAFTDLQCDDGCTGWAGIGAVIGALIGAVGVAIVAVLVLRAMDEWNTVQEQNPERHPGRAPRSGP